MQLMQLYCALMFFQMGGDFLLDDTGKVLLCHPSKIPLDRPSVTDILQAAAPAGGTTTASVEHPHMEQKLWNKSGTKVLNTTDTTEEERLFDSRQWRHVSLSWRHEEVWPMLKGEEKMSVLLCRVSAVIYEKAADICALTEKLVYLF